VAAGTRVPGAAEELFLAIQAFPREKAEEIAEAVPQRFPSGESARRCRIAVGALRIHQEFLFFECLQAQLTGDSVSYGAILEF
jgi:hypothetical protein